MKNRLREAIIESTKQINAQNLTKCDANYFSEKLEISRNTASQYLNELHNSGEVIKVITRPVMFLDRTVLRQNLVKDQELRDTYQSMAEFKDFLSQNIRNQDAFQQLIGARGSLSHIIEKCKSAVTYPGSGLPMILLGATGVGKSLIAQTMYEYGLETQVLTGGSHFVSVNCSEYSDNPEFFLTHLFGSKKGAYTGADEDKIGLLKQADGGILFLDEVHCLKPECQEKLYYFMDKGVYRQVGDTQTWHRARVQIVFATSEDPQAILLKPFLRRIPISVRIPSLGKRPEAEKKELLYNLLKQESERVHREIEISWRAYQLICEFNFTGNIGEMVNCMKVCVASALVEQRETDKLKIDIQNMPDNMIQEFAENGSLYANEKLGTITLSEMKESQNHDKSIFLFNQVMLNVLEIGEELWTLKLEEAINRHIDFICFQNQSKNQVKGLLYTGFVQNIFTKLSTKYQILISNNEILNFSKILNDLVANIPSCDHLLMEQQNIILERLKIIQECDSKNFQLTSDFITALKNDLGIDLSNLGFLDIYLFIKKFITHDKQKETRGIVLCHGFSTASSIKNTANQMLGSTVFDAIDMPMEMTSADIAIKLSNFINGLHHVKNMIILVDMGSLEEIHKNLHCEQNLNMAIVNNVTMKLVLDVGFMIKNKKPIKLILDQVATNDYLNHSVYIETQKKVPTILIVCSTGIGTSEKILGLIERSLPKEISVAFKSWDYDDLISKKTGSAVFDTHDIQHIVGTTNPQIKNYDFVSLEELIESQNQEKITKMFQPYLDSMEMDIFANNILKHFSQENLIENLTILNPEKIVGYVEEIIMLLRQRLTVVFDSQIIVGLYIHTSCLIERLITDKYITTYQDIDVFEREHHDFIQLVSNSFERLEKDYCVSIPTSEIAYLYDYIYQLRK